jgi:L-seryl-tRNA(Ser) seleniumtransferase
VVNGTGILIHTNLGRAPLGSVGEMEDALAGYSNLEWDPVTGKRGSRDARVGALLRLLTGAEAAIVVNNCASALLLALRELASDRKVIVSRSELVEIGGGFRVPEIVESSGCRLVEVGTTNKTRLADYRKKARAGECVLLKVHQSNFVQKGFVQDVPLADLAGLARKLRVPLVYDNGSGLPNASGLQFLASEPNVEQALKDGASVVVASGDKLLGSVQAGLVFGKPSIVRAMRKNPLYRALRLDKVRLMLLDQALRAWLTDGETGVPLWRMASLDADALEARKARLRLPDSKTRWKALDWVEVAASMGGGTSPETTFPSLGLRLLHKDHSADALRARFANREVPVVGYVQKGGFVLDIRTFLDADFDEVQQVLDALA